VDPDQATDLIVKITPIAAAISWSAVNQSVRVCCTLMSALTFRQLDPSTIQESKRPSQFWPVDEFHKLVVTRSRGSVAGTIGERVVFKDPLRAIKLGLKPVLYKDQDMHVDFCVDVMVVTLTRTQVQVLWQDGTREWVLSTSIIPHLNPDEYECW
jgi:ubiquitin-conjugating enzyme E2 O